jgi:hypothetical protein
LALYVEILGELLLRFGNIQQAILNFFMTA